MTYRPLQSHGRALRLAYWNADGVRPRKLELEQFLSYHGIDICLVNETHLVADRPFRLTNFVCHRTDRPAAGGGTAILVRHGIDHYPVPLSNLRQLEATAIHVIVNGRPVQLVAAYLSPTRSFIEADFLTCLAGGLPVLVAGDLNAKHTIWNSRVTSHRGSRLHDFSIRHHCDVHGPTSHTYNPYVRASRTDVLDIVITKDISFQFDLTVCVALSSDHYPVILDAHCRASFKAPLTRHDQRRVNWDDFKSAVEDNITGNPVVQSAADVEARLSEFSTVISEALEASATSRRKSPTQATAPLPPAIQASIREKNRLRREWQLHRDPQTKREMNRLQRSINFELRVWKNDLWTEKLETLDTQDSSLWKMTKQLMRVQDPTPPLRTAAGLALSDSDKAEALADSLEAQFQPVPIDPTRPPEVALIDETVLAYLFTPACTPKLTTPTEVCKAIKGLKAGKAPGPNGIPNRALKSLPKKAVTFLTKVFNGVLRFQFFPPVWKHARVISILKPGKDPTLPSSYRPISLLDTTGKLFEKILLARILHEVNSRNLIRDEQFGFRANHCTTRQVARLVRTVLRNRREKHYTGAVFLDVAKAFDTVWIEGLIYKLIQLQFPSYLVKLITSYLTNRTFVAAFHSCNSSRRFMKAGVAQGGLISPILFSLYVNDMPTPPRHVELALYADDTALVATSRCVNFLSRYLDSALRELETWLCRWRISINVSKSTAVLFVKRRGATPWPRPLELFGERIEWANSAKYLGVTLDRGLTWRHHISEVRQRAKRRLTILAPLLNARSGLSIANGLLIFKQIIRPMLTYAAPVWWTAARSHIQKLQAVQSTCLRRVTGARWYISNRQIHEDLQIDYLQDHITGLARSFGSKLENADNPLVRQLGIHLHFPRDEG